MKVRSLRYVPRPESPSGLGRVAPSLGSFLEHLHDSLTLPPAPAKALDSRASEIGSAL